jgi:hypothetical protein
VVPDLRILDNRACAARHPEVSIVSVAVSRSSETSTGELGSGLFKPKPVVLLLQTFDDGFLDATPELDGTACSRDCTLRPATGNLASTGM